MRGQVLHYDDNSGQGIISGDDGQRYRFTRADLQQLRPIQSGNVVDFVPNGDMALQVYLIAGGQAGVAQPSYAAGGYQQGGYQQGGYQQPMYAAGAVAAGPPEQLGLFGYFSKCMKMYFNGEGRARRAEYWSFVLFQIIISLAALAIFYSQVASTAIRYNAYGYNSRYAAYAAAGDLSGLILLAFGLIILSLILLPPTITVTIRRLHDVGLSGWLILLGLIPFIGGLFLFIVSLIPGQKGPNQHGPDPKGGAALNPALG